MNDLTTPGLAATLNVPFYQPIGNECELFGYAFRNRLPLLIKGPTGCGKTRFVAHMAARLARPLITVSCHDDLTAADRWPPPDRRRPDGLTDGPLTRAVRQVASAT
jgi:nitric oxide reductase NorQ protein